MTHRLDDGKQVVGQQVNAEGKVPVSVDSVHEHDGEIERKELFDDKERGSEKSATGIGEAGNSSWSESGFDADPQPAAGTDRANGVKTSQDVGHERDLVGDISLGQNIADSSNSERTSPDIGVDSAGKKCLKYIVYDKPIKTGSTSITKTLARRFNSTGERYISCLLDSCTEAATEICSGERERAHLVDHIRGKDGLLECLGEKGYYRVTSVRHPLERWESSYLYNQKKQANHFGIDADMGYAYFMNHYPMCALHDYYDHLGKVCEMARMSPDERTRRIVARYDEVIDLYDDDMIGQLHRRIIDALREENKSPRPNRNFREPFNETRLEPELKLYNALKQKQKETYAEQPLLC